MRQGFSVVFGACPGTSSCRPGWPRTHRDPPAFASQVLGLKACATTARLEAVFLKELSANFFAFVISAPLCRNILNLMFDSLNSSTFLFFPSVAIFLLNFLDLRSYFLFQTFCCSLLSTTASMCKGFLSYDSVYMI